MDELKESLTNRLGGLARPKRSVIAQHRRRYNVTSGSLNELWGVMELTIYVHGKYKGSARMHKNVTEEWTTYGRTLCIGSDKIHENWKKSSGGTKDIPRCK